MLVLRRRPGDNLAPEHAGEDTIYIELPDGVRIVVAVLSVHGEGSGRTVKVGIQAPKSVNVVRKELTVKGGRANG